MSDYIVTGIRRGQNTQIVVVGEARGPLSEDEARAIAVTTGLADVRAELLSVRHRHYERFSLPASA